MKRIIQTATLGMLILLLGCTGTTQQTRITPGVNITNELSADRMQPGGTVMLVTRINNNFDNELNDAAVKLTKSYGSRLIIEPTGVYDLGEIQDNPTVTARAQWSMSVSEQAISGERFENVVRMCFNYTQSAWHEISLVNSYDVKTTPKKGGDNGPLVITFGGLEQPFIYNNQIKSKIPLSVSIKNNYNGYLGTIDMPKGDIPNISSIRLRVYDGGGEYNPLDPDNASPQANFRIIEKDNNPRDLVCNNAQWNEEGEYFDCYINNIPVFGETFFGTRIEIINLQEEELIEKVEVIIDYTYCVESSTFALTVFQPGG